MRLLRALFVGIVLAGMGMVLSAARADCVAGVVGCSSPPRPTTTTTQPKPPSPSPTVPLPATTTTQPSRPVDTAAGERRLLELMNGERRARGLRPLSRRADVDGIAARHSARMAPTGTLWHNDDYFTAATKNSLAASFLGENVARNDSIDDMHRRLMNSPRHRDNILQPRFTVVGIGVVKGSNGQFYGTEDFLEPRAGAPVAAAAPAARPQRHATGVRTAVGAAAAAPAVAEAVSAPEALPDFPLMDMVGIDVMGGPLTGRGRGRADAAGAARSIASALALAGLVSVGVLGRRRLRRTGLA